MKAFSISIIILLYSQVCFSQNLFDKTFQYPLLYSQSSAVDDASNIYFGGMDSTSDIILSKIDQSGNLIWTRRIGQSWRRDNLMDMLFIDNKIMLAIQSDAGSAGTFGQFLLMALDTSGNTVFSEFIGDTITGNYSPIRLGKTANGFAAISNYFSGNILSHFCQFDLNGNIVNEQTFERFLSDFAVMPDNSYLFHEPFSGDIVHLDSGFTNGVSRWVMTWSSFANFESVKFINSRSGDLYTIGGYGGGTGIGIAKVKNGFYDTLTLILDTPNTSLLPLDMIELPLGDWIVLGKSFINDHPMVFIHLDQDFNPINAISTDSFIYDEVVDYNLTLLNNGTFFTTGKPYNMYMPAKIKLYLADSTLSSFCFQNSFIPEKALDSLIHFDSLSIVAYPITTPVLFPNIPNTIITEYVLDCNSTNVSSDLESKTFEIYPNPSNNFIQIKDFTGDFALTSLTGAIILNGKVRENSSIDIRHLPTGMYFLQTQQQGKTITTKVIKCNQ